MTGMPLLPPTRAPARPVGTPRVGGSSGLARFARAGLLAPAAAAEARR